MDAAYAALRAALEAPDLAKLTNTQAAAELAKPATRPKPGCFLAEGGILRVLGPIEGDAALAAIEKAADAGDSISRRVVRILRDVAGGGIDFGDVATWGLLDAYQAQGVLAVRHVDALKAYGSETVTRAELIPGWERPAPLAAVTYARNGA
jgi:hypothetical protein